MTRPKGSKLPQSRPWQFLHQLAETPSDEAVFTVELNALLGRLRTLLRLHGFRKRGLIYNRIMADGLVQVIQFQMGRMGPRVKGRRVVPDGEFTINLGIHIPEVFAVTNWAETFRFIPEVACCVRTRLGELGPEWEDMWWPIENEVELADELLDRLSNDALPFFESFGDRDLCLQSLGAFASRDFAAVEEDIIRAAILCRRGDKITARHLLSNYIRHQELPGSRAHVDYVREIAAKLGLDPID